jgi:hypothetical protein
MIGRTPKLCLAVLATAALAASSAYAFGTFDPVKNYNTGDNPQSVAAANFNADGFRDIVTADFNDNKVSVLLNKGDGTFNPFTQYDVGAEPRAVATG